MLWNIYIVLICLNLIAAITRWKYLSKPVKMLSASLCWVLFIEVLRHNSEKETLWLLTHINLSVELLFQFAYYYLLLPKKYRGFLYTGFTFYCTALFVTWNVNHSFFIEGNYLDGVFLGICMTLWGALFFYELMHKPMQYSLKSDGNFWANCGDILFYPGTLLLFGLGSYVEHINPGLWQSLRTLHFGLNLILYALYLTAFYLDKKQKLNKSIAELQPAHPIKL
jgi:hypothetical protein